MKPGRELDVLVAEKVMGVKNPPETELSDGYVVTMDVYLIPKPYSTDIAAAWEAVEKLRINFPEMKLSVYTKGSEGWGCEFSCKNEFGWDVEQIGSTAPHAICLAALKAKGG
jgi:hypothetical protein